MNIRSVLWFLLFLVLLQLSPALPCQAQHSFWERLLEIFQPAEPEADIEGKDRIEQGDSLVLSWKVEGADSIHLQDVQKHLPPDGQMTLHPEETRFYKFLLYRGNNLTRKFHKVEVYTPSIRYFTMPEVVNDEQKVRISWEVKDASMVSILGIADSLPQRGHLRTVIRDSLLTLMAKGKNTTTRRTKKVRLNYLELLDGTEKIYEGDTARLWWKYKNTSYVTIEGFKRTFPPVDTLIFLPDTTKMYHVFVHRRDGSTDTAKQRIAVSPPTIYDFSGPKYVKQEQEFPIFWETGGADAVFLGRKKVSATGYRMFEIHGDSTFMLTLKKKDTFVLKVVNVKTLPPRPFVKELNPHKKRRPAGMDCDIISLDRSGYPDSITMRVVIVDTVGNFIHSLAPPYTSQKRARKFFRSIEETVNNKYHRHAFKVREIRRDTNLAYNISMVLDHSGSMKPIVDSLQDGAEQFVDSKFREDRISITKFNHLLMQMNELDADPQRIKEAAQFSGKREVRGLTALYAGIDQGIESLGEWLPNKVVVAFTDGYENASFFYFGKRAFTAKQIARKVHQRDLMLFLISFGNAVDKQVLNQLAMLSGGKHYNIQRRENIVKVFEEIPRIFRYYYEIVLNPIDSEGKHTLTLTFDNRMGSVVRAEKEFYIGNDYDFFQYLNIPTYLLTEIPVRMEVVNNPQVLALFDFDKDKLKMEYFPVINTYIEYLLKYPKSRILLAGHTDSKGSKEYCRKLSHDRAEAVKRYIMKSGIESYRIKIKACGKNHLKWDPDEDEEKARENRRVEAVLYGD